MMRTTGGRDRGPFTQEPEPSWDPATPGDRLAPLDAVDAFFQEASAALARGDDAVQIPAESHALAAALRRFYQDGEVARPELERARQAHREVIPASIVADEVADGEIAVAARDDHERRGS